MENKKSGGFSPLYILAVILGVILFKQFDFQTFTFKHLGLGIVYMLTFAMLIFFIIKGKREEQK